MSVLRSSFVRSRALVPRTSLAVRPQTIYNNVHPPTTAIKLARAISSTPTTSSEQSTVTEAITKDHRELEDYYSQITSSSDADHQTRYQNLFVWELARHSIGEEIVVYPAFETHLGPQGKTMADKDREQHLQIKKILYDWQSMKASDPQFLPKLKEMWTPLKQHMEEEEKDDLPALEKALASEEESRKMGRSFSRTKMFVPTRSHPGAPDKPPFETAAGLLAAPLDKIMDAFKKFPKDG